MVPLGVYLPCCDLWVASTLLRLRLPGDVDVEEASVMEEEQEAKDEDGRVKVDGPTCCRSHQSAVIVVWPCTSPSQTRVGMY